MAWIAGRGDINATAVQQAKYTSCDMVTRSTRWRLYVVRSFITLHLTVCSLTGRGSDGTHDDKSAEILDGKLHAAAVACSRQTFARARWRFVEGML